MASPRPNGDGSYHAGRGHGCPPDVRTPVAGQMRAHEAPGCSGDGDERGAKIGGRLDGLGDEPTESVVQPLVAGDLDAAIPAARDVAADPAR